ncbi:PLP-dependent aminotransferase family protein [Nonomuraea sp. NPDC050556]|uniref:PLP-dependent aminotransferase family protein n=1 Tax=Nonomuraea sp. NPDC050556 TaxID=3364369 RepID=UPI0037A3E478
MRNARRLSVPIRLDRDRREPLQDQLADQLRRAIDTGQLAVETRIPSTRTMAGVLRISRGVVLSAYEVLYAEGYIVSRPGSGTYVAPGRMRERGSAQRAHEDTSGLIDMTPGRPGVEGFPLAAWRAAWRRATHREPPNEDTPALGLPELRAAIAAHLRDSRGLVLDGHEVIVTSGYGQALRLVMRASGRRTPVIGLEDPAPPGLRRVVRGLGAVLPIPVDLAGARVDLIPRACDTLVVMPERNDPLGVRMSLGRREALAAWAAERGALVIEPAFDGVFNAGLGPSPSIMAVGDPALTVLVGGFCDVLTPTLRLAYAVVPRRLAKGIEADIEQPSYPCQVAVTDLLTSGCVARRTDRLSAVYARKRALVRRALGGTVLLGSETGATATVLLPGYGAAELVAHLRERQVRVADLADYYHERRTPGSGIVLGYAHLDEVTLRRALAVVTRSIADGTGWNAPTVKGGTMWENTEAVPGCV